MELQEQLAKAKHQRNKANRNYKQLEKKFKALQEQLERQIRSSQAWARNYSSQVQKLSSREELLAMEIGDLLTANQALAAETAWYRDRYNDLFESIKVKSG